MFIVFLKFSENKSNAAGFMNAHKAWIKKGLDDGVFLIVGSLQPNLGGCIITQGEDRATLQSRVNDDPFVAENIVVAELHEVEPSLVNEQLNFLIESSKET